MVENPENAPLPKEPSIIHLNKTAFDARSRFSSVSRASKALDQARRSPLTKANEDIFSVSKSPTAFDAQSQAASLNS